MKSISALLLFLCLCTASSAQLAPPTQQWARTVSGQYSSPFEEVIKSTRDALGNVYVLCHDNLNIYVVKYNSSGAISDVLFYNSAANGTESAFDIQLDHNENILIGASVFSGSYYCPAVIKLAPDGTLLWERLFTGTFSGSCEVRSVAVDINNDIHFCGSKNDSLFAGKISAAGTTIWSQCIAPNSSYSQGAGNSIAADNNGFSYIAGKLKNTGGDFDIFVSKRSAAGLSLWEKLINGAAHANDEAVSIKLDNNYNCYVAGLIADTSASNSTASVIKYNSAGGQQWLRKLFQGGTFGQESITMQSFHLDNQGNSYVALKEDQLNYNSFNTKIIKLSALGNVNWTQSYSGNSLSQIPYSVSTDNFGNVYVCGTGALAVGADIFLLKYSSSGTNLFSVVYEHSSLSYETPKTLTLDNSGSIYLATTFNFSLDSKQDVGLVKFNNTGTLQFESLYNAPISSISQGRELILEGNRTYVSGTIQNDGSSQDFAVSHFDEQGFVQWQNVADEGSDNNTVMDIARSGNDLYVTGSKGVSSGSFLLKYDSIGSLQWQDTLNESRFTNIAVQSNGRPVFAGGATYRKEKDFRIAIYDAAAGNRIFQNTPPLAADFGSEVYDLATDVNDNIYAFGLLRHFNSYYSMKLQLQKFDAGGAVQWTLYLNGTDTTNMVYANTKKLYIDGNSDIYAIGSAVIQATGYVQPFIAKYNAAGTLLWQQNYSLSSADEKLGSAVIDANGFIYLLSAQLNGQPLIVRKIDPANGTAVWTQVPSVYPYQPFYDGVLALDNSGTIFIASAMSMAGNSEQKMMIAKLDPLGSLIWKIGLDGNYSGSDLVNDLKVTNNGRIYLLASAVMNNYGNIPDITLFKFCDTPDPVISSGGPVSNLCPGSSVNLQAGGGTSYLWNDDISTTAQVTADTTGAYYATVYLSDGCFKNTDTIQVQLKSPPSTPQICAVTVDSLSTHNVIGWDKTSVTGYSAFNIYREDVTNVYTLIATVDGDSLSEYHDFGANPNTTTKRYRISAVDSCGQESALSNYHNTIYIVSSGLGQYTWNPLYTIENSANPVDNYVLMREDVTGSTVWNQVSITSGTQNTLVDPNYAAFPNASYRVETVWNISCDPTRGAINTSRSNIKSPTSAIGLQELSLTGTTQVLPNPFSDRLTVKSSIYLNNAELVVYNNLGQQVLVHVFSGNETTINTGELVPGVYQYRIRSNGAAMQGMLIRD